MIEDNRNTHGGRRDNAGRRNKGRKSAREKKSPNRRKEPGAIPARYEVRTVSRLQQLQIEEGLIPRDEEDTYCRHDYDDPIRKGRAHYLCRRCGLDITMDLVLLEDAKGD